MLSPCVRLLGNLHADVGLTLPRLQNWKLMRNVRCAHMLPAFHRFDPSASTQRTKLAVVENPAPSSYSGDVVAYRSAAGGQIDNTTRFKQASAMAPPPNNYSLHPSVGDSMFNRTYNHSLKKT